MPRNSCTRTSQRRLPFRAKLVIGPHTMPHFLRMTQLMLLYFSIPPRIFFSYTYTYIPCVSHSKIVPSHPCSQALQPNTMYTMYSSSRDIRTPSEVRFHRRRLIRHFNRLCTYNSYLQVFLMLLDDPDRKMDQNKSINMSYGLEDLRSISQPRRPN